MVAILKNLNTFNVFKNKFGLKLSEIESISYMYEEFLPGLNILGNL